MSDPPTISGLIYGAGQDFWRSRRSLVIFGILFKLVEVWVLVPAIALIFAWILARVGYIAVSNLDILAFLLTPVGLTYSAGLATVTLALILLEQAGAIVLVSHGGKAVGNSLFQLAQIILHKMLRIVELGTWAGGLLLIAVSPLILLAVITFQVLLTEHDIYFYVKVRPPAFWWAIGIGSLLLVAGLALVAWLTVRWTLAIPILLFENQYAREALRASRERIRGIEWPAGGALLGWLIGVLLLGGLAGAAFRWMAGQVLERFGEHPLLLTMVLLAVQTVLLAGVSLVLILGLALLTRRIYLSCGPSGNPSQAFNCLSPQPYETEAIHSPRGLAWMLFLLLFVLPLAAWDTLVQYLPEAVQVQVTAHRGHARAAPENTLSAMRKAIESRADYAELDVQRTADGVVVLLHDRDLKRVAGLSRRLDDLAFDELRLLDVGSWFDPAFAGEKVPTLTEVIALCRGRMRLNIELKFYGPDRQLAIDVARILREQDFESECLVTSLNLDALQVIRVQNSKVRTGLIVSHAMGNISRLEVDVLSVRAEFLSYDVLRQARRSGREVHAWTINDPTQMARLMQRGVDNIITSDPDLAIRVRETWSTLAGTERLLLAGQLLLGIEPPDLVIDP